MNQSLSKSDFKLASDCPQKLLYKKANYPSSNDENDFLQTLAEGGYIVGKMAQLMYEHFAKENGYFCQEIVSERSSNAVDITNKLLSSYEKVILFEPAIKVGQYIIRIDILIKNKNEFSILEVKAKSHETLDDLDETGAISQNKNLKEYIEDVAFQTFVFNLFLEENKVNYSKSKVIPYLFMPNKSNRTSLDNLASWFQITERKQTDYFNSVTVSFLKPGRENELWEKGHSILQKLDVKEAVEEMLPEIKQRAKTFLKILNKEIVLDKEKLISKNCFSCEYKNPTDPLQDGYYQCLDKRAYAENHISELYFGGSVGGNKAPLVNTFLLKNQPLTIFSFRETDFQSKSGVIGVRNERQLIQYVNTREKLEYFSDAMKDELINTWTYPLHFIDFETLTCAIPHHKGMAPYETIAFQWSCHTIKQPGDAPIHSEWINTETNFPNFRFADSLMNQIGNEGTPLMWATHENTVLRAILSQLEHSNCYVENYKNDQLKDWLLKITRRKNDKGEIINEGRLLDMNNFTLNHYFHPYMKGRTSIKKTLPAVWIHNTYLHEVPYFKKYYKKDDNGSILNPYETLKFRWEEIEFENAELQETVKDGSGAMRAYHEMLFGKGRNNIEMKERLKLELLNYCELDTMAMVIIWYHWKSRFNLK